MSLKGLCWSFTKTSSVSHQVCAYQSHFFKRKKPAQVDEELLQKHAEELLNTNEKIPGLWRYKKYNNNKIPRLPFRPSELRQLSLLYLFALPPNTSETNSSLSSSPSSTSLNESSPTNSTETKVEQNKKKEKEVKDENAEKINKENREEEEEGRREGGIVGEESQQQNQKKKEKKSSRRVERNLKESEGKSFAVFQVAGKQFKASVGDVLLCPHLNGVNVGDTLALTKVLLIGTQHFTLIGKPVLSKAHVIVQIQEDTLSEKTLAYKKKRRKGYSRLQGARQRLTVLWVKDILMDFEEQEEKLLRHLQLSVDRKLLVKDWTFIEPRRVRSLTKLSTRRLKFSSEQKNLTSLVQNTKDEKLEKESAE